ncbi:uncharacterized protein [Panulirus ornatus]|uniref:uncharacterized protein n=1 Tax=Panulirus ornatus TaxID=150431 RepID=UPI003A837D5F
MVLTGMMESILSDYQCSRLRRNHYHMLIQPHLEMFKLSSGDGDTSYGFNIMLRRCQRLRHLDLSYLRTVSPPVLIRLIPTLSHVTVLNLSMTQAMDQVLGLIGHHCPELRELDVSNTPITENGLTRLCYDAQQDRPLCQHLVKLSLTGCLISAKPVCFLLQYIPTIRDIDYDDIFQVFGVMRQWGLTEDNLQSCNKYQLRILNSTNEFVDPANVDIAIALCPYATVRRILLLILR